MSTPSPVLKPTAKAVKDYFAALAAAGAAGASHELAVRHAFEELLAHAARPLGWTLVREKELFWPLQAGLWSVSIGRVNSRVGS